MFTGIVTDVGRVESLAHEGDLRAVIGTAWDVSTIATGASVACDGVCLTVIEREATDGGGRFAVEISRETRERSNLGSWKVGSPVNLERSLRVGDELGGHIVTGHVDGTGEILGVEEVEGSRRLVIGLPDGLAPLVARKGSIAVNGVSLTVNEVGDPPGAAFAVNIIPHTLAHTSLAGAASGMRVNLEIDILARYLQRMSAA